MEEEEELINRAKHGDKEAFNKLIEPYHKKMYVVAMAYLKNYADAEDAIQDTLYKIYVNLWMVNDANTFRVWIFTILKNTCNDIYRKNKKDIIPFDDKTIEIFQYNSTKKDLALFELIEFLEKEERLLLLSKYIWGFKTRELSKIFKCNESTIKMKLSKAREKIKEIYKDN